MPLVTVLLVLIVVGVLLWLINTYIPMDPKIKNIFNIVVVILVVVWLLKVFGLFNEIMGVHV
ncbi:Thivi_2564 family membrane protein [Flavobacterium aestuarii]|uniref:Thivi_2564 family membrane protein n=1 Tax=Flavobacterium aestuarii TaxID=3149227 RepID=UPI0032B41732